MSIYICHAIIDRSRMDQYRYLFVTIHTEQLHVVTSFEVRVLVDKGVVHFLLLFSCFHLWEHFTLFQKLLMTVTLETFFHMTVHIRINFKLKNLFTLHKKTKYSCHLISWKLTLTNTQTEPWIFRRTLKQTDKQQRSGISCLSDRKCSEFPAHSVSNSIPLFK